MYLEYSDEPSDTTSSTEPPLLRRSERERRQTDFYGQRCNVTDIKEPKSVSEAQTNQKWLDAMEKMPWKRKLGPFMTTMYGNL